MRATILPSAIILTKACQVTVSMIILPGGVLRP